MNFNFGFAIGEICGSFVLTLGVLLIHSVLNKKSFGISSKLQKRFFLAAGLFAIVILGIITARGFGAPGAINPAIALMVSI